MTEPESVTVGLGIGFEKGMIEVQINPFGNTCAHITGDDASNLIVDLEAAILEVTP